MPCFGEWDEGHQDLYLSRSKTERAEVFATNLKGIRLKAVLQKLEHSYNFFLCIQKLYFVFHKNAQKTLSQDNTAKILINDHVHDLMEILRHSEWKLNFTVYYTCILSKMMDLVQSALPQPYQTLYSSPSIGFAIHCTVSLQHHQQLGTYRSSVYRETMKYCCACSN